VIFDVVLLRSELEKKDLARSVVVVADVLRATSVMVTALENGAKAIIPQASDEEARALYAQLQQDRVPVLLCGEKDGFKCPGYDLGNSPTEFTTEKVCGKTIVQVTTNGTRALKAASGAAHVYIASFLNVRAVSETLRHVSEEIGTVYFVVSGKEGAYCLEDTVCLGAIITALIDPPGQGIMVTDAARTAIDLYQLYREQLMAMIRQCQHGRYLMECGLGEDLPVCIAVNTSNRTPQMVDGIVS
jgi:2-phosphosulfolactate phosphatase